MKCAEFKENLAAFALDALTEDERRACEDHLADPGPHEGCEQELRRAFEAASLIGASLPIQSPGEHVWDAIEGAIDASEEGRCRGHRAPGKPNEEPEWSAARRRDPNRGSSPLPLARRFGLGFRDRGRESPP